MEKTFPGIGEIIGKSKAMYEVFELIEKISRSDVTALLTGESGTGKELVAHEIHKKSLRCNGPFIVVNCVAIPEGLLESELFGYERGAFTGADKSKKGKFELSDKGTLFLDEIGDMPLTAQAKILRIIEEGEFESVGGIKTIQIDNRIIVASNKNLLKKVELGEFRDDLYYRLNEVKINLPSLREKKEDIPVLIDYFIQNFNHHFGKKVKGISDTALSYLMRHNWPGNARELRNVIKRAVVLIDTDTIWLEHLPVEVKICPVGEKISPPTEIMSLKDMEMQYIEKILQNIGWNKSKAARILEISRHRLDRKISAYNLKPSP